MDILGLTSTEAVRATLGVTDKDMSDSYFTDSDIETELSLHLDSWLPSRQVITSEGEAGSATLEQISALDTLKMYAKYYCADIASQSANFMLAQMESDGENEFQRYQDNKLDKLIDSIHRRMATYRAVLTAYDKAVHSGAGETTSYTQFTTATPLTDPVTGSSA